MRAHLFVQPKAHKHSAASERRGSDSLCQRLKATPKNDRLRFLEKTNGVYAVIALKVLGPNHFRKVRPT